MKYIIAIIQPHKLDVVMTALEKAEIPLMTVSNVLGRGRQKGVTEVYRGTKEAGSLLKKVKLEIAVNEEFLDRAINAVAKSARTRTGEVGDGKIFVLDLQDVMRISSGERGAIAIG
jgi:nitrogen regulatory protein P-II 2